MGKTADETSMVLRMFVDAVDVDDDLSCITSLGNIIDNTGKNFPTCFAHTVLRQLQMLE